MQLTQTKAYIIGVFVLTVPFIIHNVLWLNNSRVVNAYVAKIGRPISITSSQTFPVYEYVIGEYRYQSAGNYNMPFKVGDSVSLRYKINNPLKTRLNTFPGLWLKVMIWMGVLLLMWTLVFLHPGIIPRRSLLFISRKGIRIIPPA